MAANETPVQDPITDKGPGEGYVILLSDTHGMVHDRAWKYLQGAQRIWHAGDLGPPELIDRLAELAPLEAVFGNADPQATRRALREILLMTYGGVRFLMTHIGGRPGRYTPEARALITHHRPDVFICGHSHITLVAPGVPKGKGASSPTGPTWLHLNPGAAGHHGFHERCTMLRLQAAGGRITRLEVIDLGPRGRLASLPHTDVTDPMS